MPSRSSSSSSFFFFLLLELRSSRRLTGRREKNRRRKRRRCRPRFDAEFVKAGSEKTGSGIAVGGSCWSWVGGGWGEVDSRCRGGSRSGSGTRGEEAEEASSLCRPFFYFYFYYYFSFTRSSIFNSTINPTDGCLRPSSTSDIDVDYLFSPFPPNKSRSNSLDPRPSFSYNHLPLLCFFFTFYLLNSMHNTSRSQMQMAPLHPLFLYYLRPDDPPERGTCREWKRKVYV